MTYEEILNKRQQAFTEARYAHITAVTEMLEKYSNLTAEVKAKLPVLPGNTVEEIFPSLFAGTFSQEQYNAEFDRYEQYRVQVNAVIDSLNEEALKCLSQ